MIERSLMPILRTKRRNNQDFDDIIKEVQRPILGFSAEKLKTQYVTIYTDLNINGSFISLRKSLGITFMVTRNWLYWWKKLTQRKRRWSAKT